MQANENVRAAVRRMRPIDDEFFKQVASDKGAMEEIVRAALADESLQVESCRAQYEIDVVGRRSICADAMCRTSDGRLVNVEAQVGHRHDDVCRVRVHLSQITVDSMPKGAEFKDVPRVAVVYLADYDPLGNGLLCYTVRRTTAETGLPVNDKEVSVYVNGAAPDDGSALSRVMRVVCGRDELDFSACPRLSDRVEFIRNSEEAQEEMSESLQAFIEREVAERVEQSMEQARQTSIEQGIKQGREQGIKQGREQGIKQGVAQGLEQGRAEMLADLVAAGVLSKEDAAEWAAKAARHEPSGAEENVEAGL